MRARTQSGMTLMELMIVVVIIGVLAGISVFAYSAFIRRSRASEATTMLASIANREDSYRAEFGRFASAGSSSPPSTSLGLSNAWPTTPPGPTRVPFVTTSMPVEWNQLGFRPTGAVRYRFVAVAGTAATTPPGESGWATNPNRDLWYITEAYGDLDGDSRYSTFRIFSGNGNNVQITSELE